MNETIKCSCGEPEDGELGWFNPAENPDDTICLCCGEKITTEKMHERLAAPLFQTVSFPKRTKDLTVHPCSIDFARTLNAAWHSRLPYTQRGPWLLAFSADYQGTSFAVALWHNPSARNLPQNWLELRRLAVAPDAPHCTASFMLGRMAKWIRRNMPEITNLISYQDLEVHTGTIYKAAGWSSGWIAQARIRNRSKPRIGTRRAYRSNSNGIAPDGAGKMRWELKLRSESHEPITRARELGGI